MRQKPGVWPGFLLWSLTHALILRDNERKKGASQAIIPQGRYGAEMKKSDIIAEIQSRCKNNYGVWRIGLTRDVEARKAYWRDAENQSIAHWTAWKADSVSDAQEIKSYFIGKGMHGGTGADTLGRTNVYVYVF